MADAWLRYSWDLKELPEKIDSVASPLLLRRAEKDELAAVIKTTTSAFSMDTGWADIHKPLTQKLDEQIATVFADKEPLCLVLQYGNRIIGASVLRAGEEDENNLITGPCILHEYRSRGFGSSLLGASLLLLKDAGLKVGHGLTREKTVAGRYLYPKFGGKFAPWGSMLETPPKVAA